MARTDPGSLVKQADEKAAQLEKIMHLKALGMSQANIAKELRISKVTVNKAMPIIREMWKQNAAQSYEDHVANELAHMMELRAVLLPKARQGDAKAIDTLMRISDSARKLMGLDSPIRHEVQVITIEALDAEIETLQAQIEAKVVDVEVIEDDDLDG